MNQEPAGAATALPTLEALARGHARGIARRDRDGTFVHVYEDSLRPLCAGHFPGDPIVPGAHILGLIVDVARSLGPRQGALAIESCGFRAPLRPDGELRVHARLDASHKIRGTVSRSGGDRPIASARMRWLDAPPVLSPRARVSGAPEIDSSAVSRYLRHRGPALLIDRELAAGPPGPARARWFATPSLDHWFWTQALDAAAQAAGLCLRSEGATTRPGAAVLVVAYERVTVVNERPAGALAISVQRRRRVINIQQFDVAVETDDGAPIMTARVSLAPVEGP